MKQLFEWIPGIPMKSGMYICRIRIVDRGNTYIPVSYVRFDAHKNKWREVPAEFASGEVVEYLAEVTPPNNSLNAEDLAKEIYGDIDVIERNPFELEYNQRMSKLRTAFIAGHQARDGEVEKLVEALKNLSEICVYQTEQDIISEALKPYQSPVKETI